MKRFLAFLIPLLLLLSSCVTTAPTATTAISTPPIPIIIPTTPACTALLTEPTPGPNTPSIFPPVSETDHVRGAKDALVTITFYGDYQESRTGLFVAGLNQLVKDHPNDVRMVSRIFPLINTNDKALLAAQAAEAAAEQNRFWEMHDLLYLQQANWATLSVEDFDQWITAQASALGMNVEQFKSDTKREDIVARVQKAWDDGLKIGLPGTPIVLINDQLYTGPRDYISLTDITNLIVLGKKQFTSCPPMKVQGNKQYIATLHTEKGDVKIQLFADKAPITVNSFIFLAQHGWYDNITFHRVIPKLFAQTGDPSGTGKGNPGYYLVTEITPSLTFNRPGMVAMVNSGPDSSGSQFFITYAPTAQFDGKFTIFGQVLSGMDILETLTPRDAQPGTITPPGDKLLQVTIEEK